MDSSQYNKDFRRFITILNKLNALEQKEGDFLLNVDQLANKTVSSIHTSFTPEQFDKCQELFVERMELDRDWNAEILVLHKKGYTGRQIPSRKDMESYIGPNASARQKVG